MNFPIIDTTPIAVRIFSAKTLGERLGIPPDLALGLLNNPHALMGFIIVRGVRPPEGGLTTHLTHLIANSVPRHPSFGPGIGGAPINQGPGFAPIRPNNPGRVPRLPRFGPGIGGVPINQGPGFTPIGPNNLGRAPRLPQHINPNNVAPALSPSTTSNTGEFPGSNQLPITSSTPPVTSLSIFA